MFFYGCSNDKKKHIFFNDFLEEKNIYLGIIKFPIITIHLFLIKLGKNTTRKNKVLYCKSSIY